MSGQVLHIDFISLTPQTDVGKRQQLLNAAAALSVLDQVIRVAVIEAVAQSDFDLAVLFLLRDFEAIEPFGTDLRYSRFLQGEVAPLLRAFAGADVRLEEKLPEVDGEATCLALAAPDETYDWEISDALDKWAQDAGARRHAAGLAVGERQRFRGAVVAFQPEESGASSSIDRRFTPVLVRGRFRQLH